MNELTSVNESNAMVLLGWEELYGERISEPDLIRELSRLPLEQVLPGLIRLLQYGDADGLTAYRTLDSRVYELFPTGVADRVSGWLTSQGKPWIFFSQWQLLFAIKLICTFGFRDAVEVEVTDGQFLKLLLMINGFYPQGISEAAAIEGKAEGLKSVALKGYSLPPGENQGMLIGRYSELLGRLAAPAKQDDFSNWVDLEKVISDRLGIQLDIFKAVLFALHASTIGESPESNNGWVLPQLGWMNPDEFFARTLLPKEEVDRVLQLVSTSPDRIREEHKSQYRDGIGNPNDLRILVRNPVLTLPDDRVAAVSGQLLVQRYTNGLYWDIHDVLPNNDNVEPNRGRFQTFFGELHERYGCDALQRIKDNQPKRRKVSLLFEKDFKSESGKNPDALLIERIGNSNTRCTLFEFKVGRPRYTDSIVEGNVEAFEEDLRSKIGTGLDQEISFYQQVQSGKREIPGMEAGDISAWFFVIVVTDPFPSMSMFLDPLREDVASLPKIGKAKRYGPFILSLSELEQLETLTGDRVSEWLIRFWNDGSKFEWTFNNFYISRTAGQEITNSYIASLADDDMRVFLTPIFGEEPLFGEEPPELEVI